MKRIIHTIALSVMAVAMQAQKTYTIDECRTMALQNNVAVRNADNAVRQAREQQKEAFTNYFPTVSASAMAFTADKGLVEAELAPGMGLSLLKNGMTGSVTLTQPVFAGGQIINGNRLAKVAAEAGDVQKEQTENDVRQTVEQYFWQVVTLKEKLRTVDAVATQLDTIYKDVEMAVRVGVRTRNDLLQVSLKRNDIASSRIKLDNALALSRRVLAQYIGEHDGTADAQYAISTTDLPTFPEAIRCDHSAALQRTTGYRLLESNVQATRLQQKMALGKLLPTVAVGGGYMYHNFLDKDKTSALGFVSVSVPLTAWWGGTHNVRQKKLQVATAENLLADNSELLVIGMQKAWDDVSDAYKQLLLAHNSIEQAQENLRLNQNYYRAGTSTMTDLLQAQSLYQQSRDKYVETYAALQQKTTEYLLATGRRF